MALAEKAGSSHATVGYLEAKQRFPNVETVCRLAAALGLSAAWLAFGMEEPSNEGTTASWAGMGERLHTARSDRGQTKAALARLTKLNPGTIAGIENGGQAGVDTIEELADALLVSPAWLAFNQGPRELPKRRRSRQPA